MWEFGVFLLARDGFYFDCMCVATFIFHHTEGFLSFSFNISYMFEEVVAIVIFEVHFYFFYFFLYVIFLLFFDCSFNFVV